MEYALDFARLLTGGGPSRGNRRRSGANGWTQLRIAVLGVMLGLALPSLRGTDWGGLLPGGVRVEMPHGGRVTWPAGEVELSRVVPAVTGMLGAGASAIGGGAAMAGSPGSAAAPAAVTGARFGRCGRGVAGDCVVDGDTFRLAGEKVRIADIDTPETHPPRCAREARLGEAATERLRHLLNAGPVTLEPYRRSHDRYGRRLAVVTRGGVSLGERLIAEGLARRYDGGQRRGWCGWA